MIKKKDKQFVNSGLKVLQLLALVLVGLVGTGLEVQAEIVSPGERRGFFQETRWGYQVFHCGPHHEFVSDAVAEKLKKLEGKPLQILATKVFQPMNPGGSLIERAGEIREGGLIEGLKIEAKMRKEKVVIGSGVEVQIILRNNSDHEIVIDRAGLALVLASDIAKKREFGRGRQKVGKRFSWRYSRGNFYNDPRAMDKPMGIGCHQTFLVWSGEKFVGAEDTGSGISGSTGEPIKIKAKETFKASFASEVSRELPEGKFELFVYLRNDRTQPLVGPMSSRVPFDVKRN